MKNLQLFDLHHTHKDREGESLKFTGELIAEVSSQRGWVERWAELRLYRARSGGTYVCEEVGCSIHRNEQPIRTVRRVKTVREIKEFFGSKALARHLYEVARIDELDEEFDFDLVDVAGTDEIPELIEQLDKGGNGQMALERVIVHDGEPYRVRLSLEVEPA